MIVCAQSAMVQSVEMWCRVENSKCEVRIFITLSACAFELLAAPDFPGLYFLLRPARPIFHPQFIF
jgi:hypothetical protein